MFFSGVVHDDDDGDADVADAIPQRKPTLTSLSSETTTLQPSKIRQHTAKTSQSPTKTTESADDYDEEDSVELLRRFELEASANLEREEAEQQAMYAEARRAAEAEVEAEELIARTNMTARYFTGAAARLVGPSSGSDPTTPRERPRSALPEVIVDPIVDDSDSEAEAALTAQLDAAFHASVQHSGDENDIRDIEEELREHQPKQPHLQGIDALLASCDIDGLLARLEANPNGIDMSAGPSNSMLPRAEDLWTDSEEEKDEAEGKKPPPPPAPAPTAARRAPPAKFAPRRPQTAPSAPPVAPAPPPPRPGDSVGTVFVDARKAWGESAPSAVGDAPPSREPTRAMMSRANFVRSRGDEDDDDSDSDMEDELEAWRQERRLRHAGGRPTSAVPPKTNRAKVEQPPTTTRERPTTAPPARAQKTARDQPALPWAAGTKEVSKATELAQKATKEQPETLKPKPQAVVEEEEPMTAEEKAMMERLDQVKHEAARRRAVKQAEANVASRKAPLASAAAPPGTATTRPSTAPPASRTKSESPEAHWLKLLSAANVPKSRQIFHGAASFSPMPALAVEKARVHAVLRISLPPEEALLPELLRWLLSQRAGMQAPQDRACAVPPFSLSGLQLFTPDADDDAAHCRILDAMLVAGAPDASGSTTSATFRANLVASLQKLCGVKRSASLGRLLSSKAEVVDSDTRDRHPAASLIARVLGSDSDTLDSSSETTVSLLPPGWQERPALVAGCLNRAAAEGLHLAGLRTAVLTSHVHPTSFACPAAILADGAESSLVLALRGVGAAARWRAAVGPADAELARLTDAGSLNAIFGSGEGAAVIPATAATDATTASRDVALVFGARAASTVHTAPSWRHISEDEALKAVSATSEGATAGTLLALRPVQQCMVAAPAESLGELLSALSRRRLVVRGLTTCDSPPRDLRGIPVRDGPRGATVFAVIEGEGSRAIAAALCESPPEALAGMAWSNLDTKGWMLSRPSVTESSRLATLVAPAPTTSMADVPTLGVIFVPLEDAGNAAEAIAAVRNNGLEVISARCASSLSDEQSRKLLSSGTSSMRSMGSTKRDSMRRAMMESPVLSILCLGADAPTRLADIADGVLADASVLHAVAARDPVAARSLAMSVFPFASIPGGESSFCRLLNGPDAEDVALAFATHDVMSRGDLERLLRVASRGGFTLSGVGLGHGWRHDENSTHAGFVVGLRRPNARAQLTMLAKRAMDESVLSRVHLAPQSSEDDMPVELAHLLAHDAPAPIDVCPGGGKLWQTTCAVVGPLEASSGSVGDDEEPEVGCAELAEVLGLLRSHGFKLAGARWLAPGDVRLTRYARIEHLGVDRCASLEQRGALVLAASRDNAISRLRMELSGSAKHLSRFVHSPGSVSSAHDALAALDLEASSLAPAPAAQATAPLGVDDRASSAAPAPASPPPPLPPPSLVEEGDLLKSHEVELSLDLSDISLDDMD